MPFMMLSSRGKPSGASAQLGAQSFQRSVVVMLFLRLDSPEIWTQNCITLVSGSGGWLMKHVFSGALLCLAVLGSTVVAHAASAAAMAQVVVVPEPATITMLGAGLAGLAFWKRRQK